MRERNGIRYIIKVFEAQWDKLHDETVKPFFEQLKRDTNETYLRRNGASQNTPGHDAQLRYDVIQNAEGLKDALYRHDQGVDQRRKIAYFACHGKRGVISAVQDISRRRLKNILAPLTSYDGLYFGACDFVPEDGRGAARRRAFHVDRRIRKLDPVAGGDVVRHDVFPADAERAVRASEDECPMGADPAARRGGFAIGSVTF